jgi:hypothetical protein
MPVLPIEDHLPRASLIGSTIKIPDMIWLANRGFIFGIFGIFCKGPWPSPPKNHHSISS